MKTRVPTAQKDLGSNMVAAVAAGTAVRRLKILVVDDDELVLLNTVTMLEDLGHSVIQANSGQVALTALAGLESVDLLVTDHAMPGMTGAQLAQRVIGERPRLPVILATGYDELPTGEGQAYVRLLKPFGQRQLSLAIERALLSAAALVL